MYYCDIWINDIYRYLYIYHVYLTNGWNHELSKGSELICAWLCKLNPRISGCFEDLITMETFIYIQGTTFLAIKVFLRDLVGFKSNSGVPGYQHGSKCSRHHSRKYVFNKGNNKHLWLFGAFNDQTGDILVYNYPITYIFLHVNKEAIW